MPNRLFTPGMHHVASASRVDAGGDIRDVLALVTLHAERITKELVIGLDLGRVIRVVETRDLPTRARKQLEHHERTRPRLAIYADALYVMDVQAVECLPDAPGADDPMFLYGVLRGPYPQGLVDGVYGIEGQLATTRGPLLDGLAFGIERSFLYESGHCGKTCTHAALPIDIGATRSLVLAFPLVPMGDDGSNELVAAELIHEVLGAMRTDLGDDLARDPVPVPNRRQYERDLVKAGWKIKGEMAVNRSGRGRIASLFVPARKQKLPREIKLAAYAPLVAAQLARLPGWPEERRALHDRLGLKAPAPPLPTPPKNRSQAQQAQKDQNDRKQKDQKRNDLKDQKDRIDPKDPKARKDQKRKQKTKNRKKIQNQNSQRKKQRSKEWIAQLVDEHARPGLRRPRVANPARAAGASTPDWMFDDRDLDDD